MRKRKIGQVLALFMLILGLGMTADETEQLWQSESTGTTGETTEEGGYIADTIEVPTLTEAEAPQAQAAGEGMQKQMPQLLGASLPLRYDARDYGYVTSVKDQQDNTCWAYSAVSMAESDLISGQTPVEGSVLTADTADFSEDHLIYSFYHVQDDPLGNTTGDKNEALGWYRDVGGNHIFTTFGLAGWTGLVGEQKAADVDWESETVDMSGFSGEVTMKNAYWINLKQNASLVKQQIMQHGSVAISMYYALYYMQKENAAYYNYVTGSVNHAVAIVGWDDTYSADNFKVDPGADGAWLAKNSYGTSAGDDGYFWISYQDKALVSDTAKAFVFDFETADDCEYIYQHDGSAGAYMDSKAGDTGYRVASGDAIANVFTVPADTKTGYQTLNAVSFALFAVSVDYSVQIYKNPVDEKEPAGGTPMLSEPITGKTSFVGYYTIPLEEEVILSAGDTFSVVITLSKSNGNDISFFVDKTYTNANWISFVNAVDPGESFAYQAGSWNDLAESGATARIKAFAGDYLVPAQSLQLNRSSLELWNGQTAELTADILPENASYPKAVWNSSDTSVAAVDEDGHVTAVGKGTAVITASAKDAPAVKAECRITVRQQAEKVKFTSDAGSLTCQAGGKVQLEFTIVPNTAEVKDIYFQSSDDTVAGVDEQGIVYGKKAGIAVIGVYSVYDRTLLASCQVKVQEKAEQPGESEPVENPEEPGVQPPGEMNDVPGAEGEPSVGGAETALSVKAAGNQLPKTDDTNDAGFWGFLAAVSLLTVCGAQRRWKRRN